jgi:hypothetical protein
MVNEEIKVQRGLELNFAETDQDTRNALSNVVDQEMVAEIAISQPTEQELMGYYSTHKMQYYSLGSMTVCDLVVANRPDDPMQRARMAASALRTGAALLPVLQRYGLVNKNNCEENFYFAHKIHLGDKIYAAATGLPSGAVSDPVQSTDGVHIVWMITNSVPVPLSFGDARAQVVSDYKTYRETRVRAGTMSFLRHRAKILIADDYSDYQVYGPQP